MQTNRRNYSPEFKARIVLEYLQGKSPSELCREHALNVNLLYKWHKEFREGLNLLFEKNKTNNEYQTKLEKLERIIGKQTIEIDFLKRGLAMFN
jgi:transposase